MYIIPIRIIEVLNNPPTTDTNHSDHNYSVEDPKFVFVTGYSWSGSLVPSGALLLELGLWL